jgi:hypothetical protein
MYVGRERKRKRGDFSISETVKKVRERERSVKKDQSEKENISANFRYF